MAVTIIPGCTELQRMLSAACWRAVDLVSRRTAALLAWYAGMPSLLPMMPAMEDMLTMEPPPESCMAGMAALVPRKTPLALMSSVLSQNSRVVSSSPTTAAADAGVVDEDVEPAVAVEGGLHGGIPFVGACYVEVDVGCVAAKLGYLGFGLPAFIVEDVADDDFCAFPGE